MHRKHKPFLTIIRKITNSKTSPASNLTDVLSLCWTFSEKLQWNDRKKSSWMRLWIGFTVDECHFVNLWFYLCLNKTKAHDKLSGFVFIPDVLVLEIKPENVSSAASPPANRQPASETFPGNQSADQILTTDHFHLKIVWLFHCIDDRNWNTFWRNQHKIHSVQPFIHLIISQGTLWRKVMFSGEFSPFSDG